jgi:hypothetical protein
MAGKGKQHTAVSKAQVALTALKGTRPSTNLIPSSLWISLSSTAETSDFSLTLTKPSPTPVLPTAITY